MLGARFGLLEFSADATYWQNLLAEMGGEGAVQGWWTNALGSTKSQERFWPRAARPEGEGQDGPSLKIADRVLDAAA
jgi:hypothetical protein